MEKLFKENCHSTSILWINDQFYEKSWRKEGCYGGLEGYYWL